MVMRVQNLSGGGVDGVRRTADRRAGRALGELRRQRGMTQVELAKRLEVSQATVSKFEKSNPAVSTMLRYVEALGGQLEVAAVFGDRNDDRINLEL